MPSGIFPKTLKTLMTLETLKTFNTQFQRTPKNLKTQKLKASHNYGTRIQTPHPHSVTF
jgi:hypothetical protein